MTKTNKSFFMVALSLVVILSAALFASVMPVNASAESRSANGLVAWREYEYRDEFFNRTLRLYKNEDSRIDILGADGECFLITYDGMYYAGADEDDYNPIDLVIPSVSASDERGEYIDYVFTRDFFSPFFADTNAIEISCMYVYIVVEDIDFFEGKTFVEGDYVQEGDSLANKYVRYYIDRDSLALETNKYYISMYTDDVIPQSSHLRDGYIDFYFSTDRLNEENLIVDNFVDRYDETSWESTAFVYLDEIWGEIFSTEGYVRGDEVEVGDCIADSFIRVYKYGTGFDVVYNGESLNIGYYDVFYNGMPLEDFVGRCFYIDGEDDMGEYKDYYFTMEMLESFVPNHELGNFWIDGVYFLEKEGELDIPSDEPSDEPNDTPNDEPTEEPSDKPSDEPTEEPSETPSDNKEIDKEKLIMFGGSTLLLVATLAFIISLFKKRK